MFTSEERVRLRSELLNRASADARISGAAITGSAADGREDRWSDIDLAFGIAATAGVADALTDWTAHMYDRYSAVHHIDVLSGAWTYRVFLLPDTLQVDLAFVPEAEFRALAPAFRLVHGAANEPKQASPPPAASIAGLAWLYALHARSSIARGRLWQAEYMVSGVRDHALALACLRHGVSAAHGRGIDALPPEVTAPFEASIVRSLDAAELSRAFGIVIQCFIGEIRKIDPAPADRLEETVAALADSLPRSVTRP